MKRNPFGQISIFLTKFLIGYAELFEVPNEENKFASERENL